jgi:hypothetical protein
MNNVDPSKPKQFIPLTPAQPEPSKPTAKASPKPAMDPEFVPSGPKPSYGTLFGPGVSGTVFGNASPNVEGMSDQQLVAKTRELVTAMRAKPGKVNDYDFKQLGAMQKELATRIDARLSPKKSPEQMSSSELGTTLFTFDLAKASGMKLTKEQEAWYAKAEGVWQKRLSVDPQKALAEIEEERKVVKKELQTACGAAALGAVGMLTHFEAASMSASLLSGAAAFEKHDWAGVAKEIGIFGLSKLKGGVVIEAIGVASTAAECKEAKEKLEWLDKAALVQQQKLKEKEKP